MAPLAGFTDGPTHVRIVLANSLVASISCILHTIQLQKRKELLVDPSPSSPAGTLCYSWGGDLLVVGIVANYAAVAADTFSSELGILSKSEPRLITSLTLRKVPRGTNGGVTLMGLGAGLMGSLVVVTAATLFLPTCTEQMRFVPGGGEPWSLNPRRLFMAFMVIWGALGSVLDSVLGAVLQRSVRDVRSGKIIEGDGGSRVLVSSGAAASGLKVRARAAVTDEDQKIVDEAVDDGDEILADKYNPKNKHRTPSFRDQHPSRVVESGLDLLDNNGINFLMAVVMTLSSMAVVSLYWNIPLQGIMAP